MANRYLILSDLHLTEIEDHEDGWKYYKSSRYVFDDSISSLLNKFISETPQEMAPILVLNGDTFDFDLLSPECEDFRCSNVESPKSNKKDPQLASPSFAISLYEKKWTLHPTPLKSCWKLKKILSHHPKFLEALARFLCSGGKIVYILGNHDRELTFPEVQQTLLEAIQKKIHDQGISLDIEAPEGPMSFEPWFYHVPGELYVEHGQQYDYYTSYRHVLHPIIKVKKRQEIALPMGNISNRYLMSRMGYFNPYATDYILNIFAYLSHWFRYYALTKRSLALSWFIGSLVVMRRLLRTKRKRLRRPVDYDKKMEAQARRAHLPLSTVKKIDKLRRPPIINQFFKIIREFWLDRLALAVLMIGGTLALALVPIPLWIQLTVPLSTFPLIFFIYETALTGESVLNVERTLPRNARYIADLLEVQLVAFGHTHIPQLIPLDDGVSFVDTGTWAPITYNAEDRRLKPGLRNYLTCSFNGPQKEFHFDCWPVEPQIKRTVSSSKKETHQESLK